jgi:hypothetical protein
MGTDDTSYETAMNALAFSPPLPDLSQIFRCEFLESRCQSGETVFVK